MKDKEAIRKVVIEIDNSMTRIDAERDFIKEAIAAASEKHEIDKKTLRAMARLYHKYALDVEDAREASERLFEAYDRIIRQP